MPLQPFDPDTGTKYVLVSGGVISGIGKGVIASSLGVLLKSKGLRVTAIKIDPYMNIDAGLMNPLEYLDSVNNLRELYPTDNDDRHGECFVLDDGGEVDLDLGNYERYLNITLTRANNITTGKIYQHVIQLERESAFLGKTVQIVPHLTNEVQKWIQRVAKVPVDPSKERPDICIIELGGTVGDIESAPFIEALRCLRRRAGQNNFLHCHVSLVPVIHGEQKTKPTQAAIKAIRSEGLSPDIIACRCEAKLADKTTEKIAMYCQVEPSQVIAVHDVGSTYSVPPLLEDQGLISSLNKVLQLDAISIPKSRKDSGTESWQRWKALTAAHEAASESVEICIVGKYTALPDSYLSVKKALEHASMRCHRKVDTKFVDSNDLEATTHSEPSAAFHAAHAKLRQASGILVPGGFGITGTEGMVVAAKIARENKIPYLGICFGMQVAVVEFCRHVCGIHNAHSEEWEVLDNLTEEEKAAATKDRVVINMPEVSKTPGGANQRLGLRTTVFQENSEFSKLRALYESEAPRTNGLPAASDITSNMTADGEPTTKVSSAAPLIISERHRHRYEVNPRYVTMMSENGLDFIGKDESGERMEILELKDHPWFVGVQYHPEYLSKVLKPSMPYLGFMTAAAHRAEQITDKHTTVANGF
ncbi:MAG: hypothetical protein Q9174_000944 [Haloplaca sp. 1 TL-2023]